jgi:hypothetical protein
MKLQMVLQIKLRHAALSFLATAILAALPVTAAAQSLVDEAPPSESLVSTAPQPDLSYTRPTQQIKLHNYFFDAFGPYPIVGSLAVAGIGQFDNAPSQWGQSPAGYSKRFASDLGIAATSTTTRYALAQAFREDTLYYRCECSGLLPRLGHALLSSFTARRGLDGHRVFSASALVSPYVGTETAVHAWYPGNYGNRYALRMGNYNLLAGVGQNIMMEFFYSGPHSLLSRMHLNNRNAAPAPDSK